MKKQKATASVTALILAAGKGTRMKSSLPKVMHKVAGFPMVCHSVSQALKLGAAPIALVTAPGMDKVLETARMIDSEIDSAIQKEQLGTAHAVLAAKNTLGQLD